MTMILDVATSITSPDSMVLFDDTTHKTVYYAPREWRLSNQGGNDMIQYNEWPDDDVAFLSIVLTPFFQAGELDELKKTAASLGLTAQPVRYLGKDDSGSSGGTIIVPYAFPSDSKFRCEVNAGKPGTFANPVPIVFSTNLKVGRMLRDIVRDASQPVGMAFQIAQMIRGATTSFHARVTVDYDRTFEMLSIHTSWSWWVWSGDIQAAWQTLIQTGAITVEILGGTADQKTIAYKMAEWMRDMFFKPELGNVTQPSQPNSGIIRTSVRYEKQHEHKHFEVEFNERDFTEAPYNSVACTGTHPLGKSSLAALDLAMTRHLLDGVTRRGTLVRYDEFPASLLSSPHVIAALSRSVLKTQSDATRMHVGSNASLVSTPADL